MRHPDPYPTLSNHWVYVMRALSRRDLTPDQRDLICRIVRRAKRYGLREEDARILRALGRPALRGDDAERGFWHISEAMGRIGEAARGGAGDGGRAR